MESEDIVDICPTETVYTLCVVANNAYLLSLACELVDDSLLGKVSVLILIHKHIFEPFGIFVPYVVVVDKQDVDVHEQVVEVHGICLTASLAIP